MAVITMPVGILLDDAGAILTAPVVTITSVTDKAGSAIASPGATVNASGTATPVSVDYDAEAKGEAWITLAVSQAGRTVTGVNAAPAFYVARDSSRIITNITGDAFARLGAPGGVSISADIAAIPAALLDASNGIETAMTLRQALRLMVAVLAGKATEAPVGTYTVKRQDGTTTAVTITHDTIGTRSLITIGSL